MKLCSWTVFAILLLTPYAAIACGADTPEAQALHKLKAQAIMAFLFMGGIITMTAKYFGGFFLLNLRKWYFVGIWFVTTLVSLGIFILAVRSLDSITWLSELIITILLMLLLIITDFTAARFLSKNSSKLRTLAFALIGNSPILITIIVLYLLNQG